MGKIVKALRTVRVNERIKVPQVRLVDESGNMIGVVETRSALEQARDRGYDLVMVSPGSVPPVCRIMDYGKYKYEQSKKAKKAKKKQHVMHLKEIKLRPRIEEHDYRFKMNHARRFLEHYNKVKFSLIFRGREITHADIGLNLLNRVAEDLSDIAMVEAGPKKEGRTIMMVVCPKPGIRKATEEPKKEREEEDATHEEGGAITAKTEEDT